MAFHCRRYLGETGVDGCLLEEGMPLLVLRGWQCTGLIQQLPGRLVVLATTGHQSLPSSPCLAVGMSLPAQAGNGVRLRGEASVNPGTSRMAAAT